MRVMQKTVSETPVTYLVSEAGNANRSLTVDDLVKLLNSGDPDVERAIENAGLVRRR